MLGWPNYKYRLIFNIPVFETDVYILLNCITIYSFYEIHLNLKLCFSKFIYNIAYDLTWKTLIIPIVNCLLSSPSWIQQHIVLLSFESISASVVYGKVGCEQDPSVPNAALFLGG